MDVPAGGEMLQDWSAVVADRSDSVSTPRERFPVLFQLDELGLAVGSPVGGAMEQQKCALGAFDGIERVPLVRLIGRFKTRNACADWESIGPWASECAHSQEGRQQQTIRSRHC